MYYLWKKYKTPLLVLIFLIFILYLAAHIPALNSYWQLLGYYFSLILTNLSGFISMLWAGIIALLNSLQLLLQAVITICFNFVRVFSHLLNLLPGMLSDILGHAPELLRTLFTSPAEIMTKLMSYPSTREFITNLLSPIGKLIRDVVQNLCTKEGRNRIWYAFWHFKIKK